jgi:hypothetical protein
MTTIFLTTAHLSVPTARNNFLNGNIPGMFTTFPADQLQQTGVAENKVDMLDVPGKGRCYVYIARYTCIISYITRIKNIYNLHSYKAHPKFCQ